VPGDRPDAGLLAEEALNRHRLLHRMADDYREDLNELDVDHGARPAAWADDQYRALPDRKPAPECSGADAGRSAFRVRA